MDSKASEQSEANERIIDFVLFLSEFLFAWDLALYFVFDRLESHQDRQIFGFAVEFGIWDGIWMMGFCWG